jgi:hypothetical protein
MLETLAQSYNTDKYQHGYCKHYEHHIPSLSGTLLEIGILDGASLRMWRDYYKQANIIGIDIWPQYIHKDVNCILGDATKKEDIDKIDLSNLEVVIDDGSHISKDIITSFEILWPKLKSNGWYVVEDLLTQYQEGFGASVNYSIVRNLIYNLFDKTIKGEIAEFHAYEEILFLKKK